MDKGIFSALILVFIFVCLLPVTFFRQRGRFTPLWLVTAVPFILCPVGLVLTYAGILPRLTGVSTPWGDLGELMGLVCAYITLALLCYTMGVLGKAPRWFHQGENAPDKLVDYGPYARIRHPFYCAYLFLFVGAFFCAPQTITMLCLIYAYLVFNWTASQEEKLYLRSEFAEQYRQYMDRTGRFLPRYR